MMLSMASIYYANAQADLCDSHCTFGPPITDTYEICHFRSVVTVTDITGIPFTYTLDGPCVFVIIDYRTVTCNGVTSLIIDDAVYVDNTDYWNHIYDAFVSPPAPLPCNVSPYPYPNIAPPCSSSGSSNDILQGIQDAISFEIAKLGLKTTVDVAFKGACYSLVHLSFPDGSFRALGTNDLGVSDTIHYSSKSNVTQLIPCNDACCKVTFEYRIIHASNGETLQKWVPISYKGDDAGCQASPLPDYSKYPNKETAQVFDPITGTYKTVTGTVTSQDPCNLICSGFMGLPPQSQKISTDVAPKEIPLEFSAYPTIVDNFIHFSSSKNILKIVVYDVIGNEVLTVSKLEKNELNTSGLKDGIYYVQVYLSDNIVKTVKILKQ